jgi:predicted glycogen debranching enzyme
MAKSYLKFNKNQLINLNYSLNKELLRTSRNGGYSSSTIIGCNTRKYHGLLVVPEPNLEGARQVLLSNVDETLIVNGAEFHLSSRIFSGGYIHPKGHKYIRNFESDPNMKLTYRIGKTIFKKEYIFVENQSRLLLRYSVEDSMASDLTFRISPLLAYRSIHSLSKSNLGVNNKYSIVQNGASWQLYDGFSKLYFQISKKAEYVHSPDWHYNIEYPMERDRGYEFTEDLFVPGFFDINMKDGKSVVISIGLEEKLPSGFKKSFKSEIKDRFERNSFENCLKNAADQFLITRNNKKGIIAGYHWFGRWGRDTFISLPGICLTNDNEKEFHLVLQSMIDEMKNGNFNDVSSRGEISYHSADTIFWFFRCLHKLHQMAEGKSNIWKQYKKIINSILEDILTDKNEILNIHENGLIWANQKDKAISWMDSTVDGHPVVPRQGYLVETNAIWYDAISFFLELAKAAKDQTFIKKWAAYPERIKSSFSEIFWSNTTKCLADYVDKNGANWDIRPNMIFALSEKYSPLTEDQKEYVLKLVHEELLTRRGLRTLSPNDLNYRGKYEGNERERDLSYHQGTIWPWLTGAFAEAYLKMHPNTGRTFIEKIYNEFESEMKNAGIGTISEIYEGNPPFEARGAISQATNVGELLRIKWMLENSEKI